MRISDWSSDVCSSDLQHDLDAVAARLCRDRFVDLVEGEGLDEPIEGKTPGGVMRDQFGDEALRIAVALDDPEDPVPGGHQRGDPDIERGVGFRRHADEANRAMAAKRRKRSEERRVRNASVSTCRSRWSP